MLNTLIKEPTLKELGFAIHHKSQIMTFRLLTFDMKNIRSAILLISFRVLLVVGGRLLAVEPPISILFV
jgi:hypothetical protein